MDGILFNHTSSDLEKNMSNCHGVCWLQVVPSLSRYTIADTEESDLMHR